MLKIASGVFAVLVLSGCANVVPPFDLPQRDGAPSIESIRKKIRCELGKILTHDDLNKYLTDTHDIYVAILLNLDVTDDGALAPTYSLTNYMPTFSGGASFEQSREQNFQEQLFFSFSELKVRLEGKPPPCGDPVDTNLAGELGIEQAWNLALTAETDIRWDGTGVAGGAFGGTVAFTVKKQITATGPTWTLTHFKGPGAFLTAYENNVDKLTYAFVQGPRATKDKNLGKQAADRFLQTILTGNISTSLTTIQNKN